MSQFVHLRVHSEFSLTDGIVQIEAPKRRGTASSTPAPGLVQAAAAAGYPAVALTDLNNLFGSAKLCKSAESIGLKPLVGVDLTLHDEQDAGQNQVVVLATSPEGQRNLNQLLSRAYKEGQTPSAGPRVKRQWLEDSAHDLIVLVGKASFMGRQLLQGRHDEASRDAARWKAAFGDRFYIEIQRLGRQDDESHVQAAITLAARHRIPVVATNDVRFMRKEDFEAHEARHCIATGRVLADRNRPKPYSQEQYFKSPSEMGELFQDIPSALQNTVEIAKRANPSITFGAVHLPKFPVPDGRSIKDFIRDESEIGLQQRLQAFGPKAPIEEYSKRLDYELSVIEKMGFSGYFVIVSDFIRWSKSNGVPVGPGRGSGAGSLVAYSLGITDLDPIEYDLLFERFLNPDRVSLPDFDVDFCQAGRERVIRYVAEKYGADHVSQIVTYSTMAARGVIHDSARVLGFQGLGNRLSKMVPGEPAFKAEANMKGMSALEAALEVVPELRQEYQANEEARSLIDLGLQLEGITRGVGIHAGGVVISPAPLTDFVALYCDEAGQGVVTQYDMKDVEGVGLIKFDFLGLRTLTIVESAVQTINKRHPGLQLDILKIPRDDPKTFETYGSGALSGVFQMESAGMSKLSADFKPTSIEDLTAIVSLYRPGPMDLIPDYIASKRGEKPVEYLHPDMEESLKKTYGIMVYQEQVMQIARKVAGYTLGAADLLRRAMGKKKPEEMAKQREVFLKGSADRGIDAHTATQIFDQMEKFANYGFNKSHAAAYALVSYQTAWLKTHYPSEFMAAVLSSEMHNTDKVVPMVQEAIRMGLKVLPPSIQHSAYAFTAIDNKTLVYGLGAIRGIGSGVADSIAEARVQQPFTSLGDFCRRIDARRLTAKTLEALIKAGAMDCLNLSRATLMDGVQEALGGAKQSVIASSKGQDDLFGAIETQLEMSPAPVQAPEWDDITRLTFEHEALGMYLTGHPFNAYKAHAARMTDGPIAHLIAEYDRNAVQDSEGRFRRGEERILAGWLMDVRRVPPRAFLLVGDDTAVVNCLVGDDLWPNISRSIQENTLIFVRGRLAPDTFSGGHQIYADQVLTLDQMFATRIERLTLDFGSKPVDMDRLGRVLAPMRQQGGVSVFTKSSVGGRDELLPLGEDWRIAPTEHNLRALKVELPAIVLPRIQNRAGNSRTTAPSAKPAKREPAPEVEGMRM